MKKLLEAINRGILRNLNENNIELLADLEDENLDQLDSIQTKSINNNVDYSIKGQLIDAIQTGKIHGRLKQLINDRNNFGELKGLIKANDKEHLKELIKIGLQLLGDDGNFNWIDTIEITDMSNLFSRNYTFNGHIELWNVSKVTDMSNMFAFAKSFNQSIGGWDVSSVTHMNGMFEGAESFNRPIGGWDVSNVYNMSTMFQFADKFNQPIGGWDVSNVGVMYQMFEYARSFNQPINNWVIKDTVNTWLAFHSCPIKEEYKPNGVK